MPYVSNVEKEDARWISQVQAIEHICKVDGCTESEARRQLHSAASDRPEIVHPDDWAWRHPGGPFVRSRFPSPAELEAHHNNPSKRFNRELVLNRWPEPVEATLNENTIDSRGNSDAARKEEGANRGKRQGNKRLRKPNAEKDAKLAGRIKAVLKAAKQRWPNKETWELRPMAIELAKSKDGQGYSPVAIRAIFQGTYSTSRRLKIPGLRG
jgi:hypothetical protein